jgi:nucleoid-associated protein EbfC
MFDRAKALYELKKVQGSLAKEIIEVQAGNGAVKVRVTGEMKIKDIRFDSNLVDPNDLPQLEKWVESAVTQAITQAQQVAAEKMQSVAGGLGLPGL